MEGQLVNLPNDPYPWAGVVLPGVAVPTHY